MWERRVVAWCCACSIVAAAVPAAAQEDEEREPTVALEWGEGLRVRSDDGAFTLEIRSRIQAQIAVMVPTAPDDEASINFLVRRARVTFRGNLFTANLEYYLQLGFAPRDMEADLLIPLRDAQIAWTELRELSLRVGQMKVPFTRERVISSSALQLVDRSIVNAELSLDRDIGVQVYSTDLFGWNLLGYQLGVFLGEGRLRANADTGLLYVGRVELFPFGRFEDAYSEVDLTREARPRLAIAAGGAWNQRTRRMRSTFGGFYQLEGFDYAHFQADLMFKMAGFSLLAEVVYRGATSPSERVGEVAGIPIVEVARNAVGFVGQAGYLFSREVPIELAARYAHVEPIGEITAVVRQRELTAGLSWYPMGHDLKLQLDYSYLASPRFSDGTHRVRLQTQAYF